MHREPMNRSEFVQCNINHQTRWIPGAGMTMFFSRRGDDILSGK